MPKSVNKVILIGNVGKDPDVKYTTGGTPVAKFSLATNERYKDRSGEWHDKAEWHQLVAWQRTAEIVGEYVQKGSRIYVEGRLQTSSWEDKQSGEKKYRTEIVVKDLTLLDGKGEVSGTNGTGRNGHNDHSFASRRPENFDQRQPGDDFDEVVPTGALTDEDIPF